MFFVWISARIHVLLVSKSGFFFFFLLWFYFFRSVFSIGPNLGSGFYVLRGAAAAVYFFSHLYANGSAFFQVSFSWAISIFCYHCVCAVCRLRLRANWEMG